MSFMFSLLDLLLKALTKFTYSFFFFLTFFAVAAASAAAAVAPVASSTVKRFDIDLLNSLQLSGSSSFILIASLLPSDDFNLSIMSLTFFDSISLLFFI